jgi:mannose/fructose-specific phosphotransferase system component IIA
MLKIFLSTHGMMASGMKQSLDILVGNTDCLTVFDAYINEEPVEKHVEAFLEKYPDDTKILCSDIYCGSVNQVLTKYCGQDKTFVVTGVNLPLLMSFVLSAEEDLTEKQVEEMVLESRELTRMVTLDFEAPEEEEFF